MRRHQSIESTNSVLREQRCIKLHITGFEVVTAAVMNITPCSPLKIDRRFRGTYGLHVQIRRIRWFLVWLIFWRCRRRRCVPPKRLATLNGLHGVISQNTLLFRLHFFYHSSVQLCMLTALALGSLHSVFIYFVRFSVETAIIALNKLKRFIFVMGTQYIFCRDTR
jgi:hypothetical protein